VSDEAERKVILDEIDRITGGAPCPWSWSLTERADRLWDLNIRGINLAYGADVIMPKLAPIADGAGWQVLYEALMPEKLRKAAERWGG
jgi:hypothetical protein